MKECGACGTRWVEVSEGMEVSGGGEVGVENSGEE